MDIKRINASGESCNFCTNGKLIDGRLIKPYETVIMITRSNQSGLLATICDKCLSELIEFKNNEP